MKSLLLQNILQDVPFENLPKSWQILTTQIDKFSENKNLFDFQQEGLKNALKGLWLYFKDKEERERKQELYKRYTVNDLPKDLDYSLKKDENKKAATYLLKYDDDYPVVNSKISFERFINRMSFWMATGSGKTLLIIKLMEMLGKLIAAGELPKRDILFLTHRDDLIDQFKEHVEEFNRSNPKIRINLRWLRNYEKIRNVHAFSLANEIDVFYYRSDLISDETKQKTVNFRTYDDRGRWYIFLDEAHKGNKEESKRQIFYSILSRNGFLFNFSATFTDPKDHATCAFDFNLAKFVERGYSKHIYVSSTEITAFKQDKKKQDFTAIDKQKIVLKTLLLLTYIHKHFEDIRKKNAALYHRPLLLTLVNSVNTVNSDLELFFRELEKVAQKNIAPGLLQQAKEDLAKEFHNNPEYEFEKGVKCLIDTGLIEQLSYDNILQYVLNAKKPGAIEVLKIPGNKKELIFKLTTSTEPFTLIRIGDTTKWLKEPLAKYEIIESYDNASYFKQISQDDSSINILMGSRSFYEGWDSKRPNLVLFINIGVGKVAKKFVLQSVGRGVRIEPKRDKRRRLQNLVNTGEIKESLFNKVKSLIPPLESLFVFGTNAENLRNIIGTLHAEKQDKSLGDAFIVNPAIRDQLLLIPIYKPAEKILAEEDDPQKFSIHHDDLDLTARFYNECLTDKIALVKYDCEVKVLQKAKVSFKKEAQENYYDLSSSHVLPNPPLMLESILGHFAVKNRELDRFKKLKDEIIHFKEIRFWGSDQQYDEIKEKLAMIQNRPERERELDRAYNEVPRQEYGRQLRSLEQAEDFKMNDKTIGIKHLANHYYLPMIVSDEEKIDYINHIINVPSEVRFITDLEKYLVKNDNNGKPDHIFAKFDWWMFSKLDETLDKITIPYYNAGFNIVANFKPDFIFWMQKGKRYLILFVDPKGTEHTATYRKIDGYARVFETDKEQSRDFLHNHDGNEYTINVKLLLKPARQDIASVSEKYRKYWFDDFGEFADKIREVIP